MMKNQKNMNSIILWRENRTKIHSVWEEAKADMSFMKTNDTTLTSNYKRKHIIILYTFSIYLPIHILQNIILTLLLQNYTIQYHTTSCHRGCNGHIGWAISLNLPALFFPPLYFPFPLLISRPLNIS